MVQHKNNAAVTDAGQALLAALDALPLQEEKT